MRVSLLAIGAGLVLASLATTSEAQRADADIFPQSQALLEGGAAAQKTGDLNAAVDLYEAALTADPRNRSAIIALAQVARAQALPGKAISLYREALLLEPNDLVAVTGQGEALVDKGAIELAREKLTDAQRLCASKCPQVTALERSIKASDAKKMVAAEAITPKPVIGGASPEGSN